MKKVTYKYGTRVLGCGCCTGSANVIEITDVTTGREVYWYDDAPTFFCKEELEEYIMSVHNLQMCEFEVDSDSECC